MTETVLTVVEILESMGEAGGRICAIDASEAGAGNISCCIAQDIDLELFDQSHEIDLPVLCPGLPDAPSW